MIFLAKRRPRFGDQRVWLSGGVCGDSADLLTVEVVYLDKGLVIP